MAEKLNIAQFHIDFMQNRASVMMTDNAGGTIQVFAPVADVQGQGKEQIKNAFRSFVERALATIDEV